MVACGCPGGRNGNTEASTTRSLFVPNTRARESTTAPALGEIPILPTTQKVSEQPSKRTPQPLEGTYKYKQHEIPGWQSPV
jgi:hypothetical protein